MSKEETAYDVYNEGVVTPNNTVNVPSVGAVNVYTEGNPVTAKAQAYKDWTAKYGVDAEKQRQQMMGEVQKIYDRSIAGYGVTGELLRQNGLNNSGIAGIYQMQAEQNRRQGTASAEAIYADTERKNRVGYGQYLDSAQGSLASTASEYAADTGEQMKFDELVKIATTIYNVDEFTAREMAQKALDLSASTAQRANQQIQGDLISSATNTALNMIGSGYNITSDLLMKQHNGLTREQADAILKDAYASLEMEYDPTTGTTGGVSASLETAYNDLLARGWGRDDIIAELKKTYSEEQINALINQNAEQDNAISSGISAVYDAIGGEGGDFTSALIALEEIDPNLSGNLAQFKDDPTKAMDAMYDYAVNYANATGNTAVQNEAGNAYVKTALAEFAKEFDEKTFHRFIKEVANGKRSDGSEEAVKAQLQMIRDNIRVTDVHKIDQYDENEHGVYEGGFDGVSITLNVFGKEMTVRADYYTKGTDTIKQSLWNDRQKSQAQYVQAAIDAYGDNARMGDTFTVSDSKGDHLLIKGEGKDEWYWLDAKGDITQDDDDIIDENWEDFVYLLANTKRNTEREALVDNFKKYENSAKNIYERMTKKGNSGNITIGNATFTPKW